MTPRLPRTAYEAQKGEGNRRAFRRLIERGTVPGVLAYEGREPVGWCAIEPRESFPGSSARACSGPWTIGPRGRSCACSSGPTGAGAASRAR